jgi:hypothetical protein
VIILTFDQESLDTSTAESAADLLMEERVILMISMFEGRVLFIVNGVNLLQPPGMDDPYCTCQVLDLAIGLHMHVVKAISEGESVYRFPGSGARLTLNATDGEIVIYSDISERGARISKDEMLTACIDFSQRVRRCLVARVPVLTQHPDLGPWFREEVDLPDVD